MTVYSVFQTAHVFSIYYVFLLCGKKHLTLKLHAVLLSNQICVHNFIVYIIYIEYLKYGLKNIFDNKVTAYFTLKKIHKLGRHIPHQSTCIDFTSAR